MTMLCNSLFDLSSIHVADKSNDENTKDQSALKSDASLPSLREPLKTFSPNSGGKVNGQPMTMKQIDAELNALRRENFDLKLRLYVENQKKGNKKTHLDDDERKERPQNNVAENFKRILTDKDNQIRNLKSQLNDLENKMKFEIGILRREKEAYANDLEASENLCKQFMEHLTEVCDFWRKFLLEASSSGDNSLLDSITNWLNSSQDILNSSSLVISEKHRDISKKINSEPSPNQMQNKLAELLKANEMKGMSSLGLLSDISHFVAKDNFMSPIPIKVDCEVQTDMVASEIKALIQTAVLLGSRSGSDAATQTQSVQLTDKDCQTCISSHFNKINQTDARLLAKMGKDASAQSHIALARLNSRSTQTKTVTNQMATLDVNPSATSNEIKKAQKSRLSQVIKTSEGQQINSKVNIESVLNKQERMKKCVDLEETYELLQHSPSTENDLTVAMKSLTTFKSNLSPITESPHLKEYSPTAILERQRKEPVNETYSLESLKLDNSAEAEASPCPNNNKNTLNRATSGKKTVSINERLNSVQKASGKVTLTPLNEKNRTTGSTIKKTSNLEKNQYLLSEGILPKQKTEKHVMLPDESKSLNTIPDDELMNSEKESDAVRVYLTFKYYKLLRGHLSQLSVRLNELDSLNKDHFILEIIGRREFSTALSPCLTNMRHTINSCRIICHHFTIVDENSVLAQFERIKAKKENIEKALTQQMKKADKLLKKAKINLRV